MAIEINSDRNMNEVKFEFPNAYLKIQQVNIRGDEVWINVNVYADKTSRQENNSISIYKVTEKCNLKDIQITNFSEAGIKEACYNYLKTITKYQGVDC